MSKNNTLGTALITGASTGIGAVYADRLARRGHDLVLVARDEQRLQTLAARLRADTGVKVEILKADLTEKAELLKIEQRLRQDISIRVLVNNAGAALAGAFHEVDVDKLESLLLLNVLAPTRLAAAAVANFVAQGQGTLINLGSVTAFLPESFSGPYSGTKAYMLNLSLNLHKEYAAKGLRVQAVLPGATRTEIWERAGHDVNALPPEMVMDVNEMVDASLAGFDAGEVVTIPSLPDAADYEALTAARMRLAPNLSRQHAAARYQH